MDAQPSTSALSVAAPFTTPPCLFTVVPLGELAAGSRTSVEGDAIRFSAAASAHVQALSPPSPPGCVLCHTRTRRCARTSSLPPPCRPPLLTHAACTCAFVFSPPLPSTCARLRCPRRGGQHSLLSRSVFIPKPPSGCYADFGPGSKVCLLKDFYFVCVCGCYCLVHKLYSTLL